MSEKVLREFKVIETDDGFRIELKGDKEELRQMLPFLTPFAGGMPHRGDPKRKGRHFGRRGFGRGPFGRRPFGGHHPADRLRRAYAMQRMMDDEGYDLGPWWDEDVAADARETGESPEQPNA